MIGGPEVAFEILAWLSNGFRQAGSMSVSRQVVDTSAGRWTPFRTRVQVRRS
jgi:hypothetical protein